MEAALPPPSMAGGPCRPRSSSKSITPNREPLVFGTNSESISEPSMGGSFCVGERGVDRSIGEANLRKGAALQWLAHLAPVRASAPSMEAALLPALALHPKSLRQIGNPWFSERTPKVLTNLLWEIRFFVGNREGIEVLAEPIFVRAQPFNGSGPAVPFNGCGPAVEVRCAPTRARFFQ